MRTNLLKEKSKLNLCSVILALLALFFLGFLNINTVKALGDDTSIVNVNVPSEILIKMNADGTNAVGDYYVENTGAAPVIVKSVTVNKTGTWNLVESKEAYGSKEMTLSFNGVDLAEGEALDLGDVKLKSGEKYEPSLDVKRGVVMADDTEESFEVLMGFEVAESKLINGPEFNEKIKSLGNFTKVIFSNEAIPSDAQSVDVSEKQDGSILAWNNQGTVTVSNQAEGLKIVFNEDSTNMFESDVQSIDFGKGIIDTEQIVDASYMFANCPKLSLIDMSEFSLPSVQEINYLYEDDDLLMRIITPVDLSSSAIQRGNDEIQRSKGYRASLYLDDALSEVDHSKSLPTEENIPHEIFAIAINNNTESGSLGGYLCDLYPNVEHIIFSNSNIPSDIIIENEYSRVIDTDGKDFFVYSEDEGRTVILTNNDPRGKIVINNYEEMFRGLNKLKSIDFGQNVIEGSIETISAVFGSGNALSSTVNMFEDCVSLESIDLSALNLSMLEDMYSMFSGCSSLNALNFGNNIDTSNVSDMSHMFFGCTSLEEIDLSDLSFTALRNATRMFYYCRALNKVTFPDTIESSSLFDASEMFGECASLAEIDLSAFDFSNVVVMYSMFEGCENLATIKTPHSINADISEGSLENVTSKTFYDESDSYKEYPAGTFPTGISESHTLVSEVPNAELTIGPDFNTKIKSLYSNSDSIKKIVFSQEAIPADAKSVDVSEAQDGSVIAWTSGDGTITITSQNPNIKIAFNEDSSNMFMSLYYVESIDFGEDVISTSNVSSLSTMFYATGLNAETFSLDLSEMDTGRVIYMEEMFAEAGKNATTFSLNLNGWNTSNVSDMPFMFNVAGKNANTWSITGLENWDVSNVENMEGMFAEAGYNAAIFSLDLSNWNVSKVLDTNYMFAYTGQNATAFSLDLSGWNVSSVTDMRYMFQYAGENAISWALKTPINIPADANKDDILRSLTVYDASNNYELMDEDGANFPTENSESHTLVKEKPVTYNITYNLDGGTLSENAPITYEKGKGLDILPTATKEGYEFIGWRKKDDRLVDNFEYNEDLLFLATEAESTQFSYNSDKDNLFELASFLSNVESADEMSIKFTLNKDADLIIATSFLSVETEDLNEMFYQQYFEDVKITDENGDEYTFSVNMPVSFKKGTYTITMKKGNATQDELYSFWLGIYAANKYEQISSEETGDITLEAYYQPVLEKVAYLDRDKMIGSFGAKNIVFSNEPLEGKFRLLALPNFDSDNSPQRVFWLIIGDTMYIAPEHSGVTMYAPEDCSELFSLNVEIEHIDFENFDTSYVKNMENMLRVYDSLDVSRFNTSNVENINGLFRGYNLDNVIGIKNLDTSNVKTMMSTFANTSKTGNFALNWNVNNVENMVGIFSGADIDELDISSWVLKDGINVERSFEVAKINTIHTPRIIPSNVSGSFETYYDYYDQTDGYKEYPAGTFPTGISESHTLVTEKPVS